MRKITKAKAAAMVLVLAMALSLTACGHEHTWADATCTAPKTCTECGETEGEALGHSWVDATCAAPKTCDLCKETEGEVLPHDFSEANFQVPATCTVCGATEGDVKTPEFEKCSVELAPHEGEYDIMLTAMDDSGTHRMGKIWLADYQIFESDETHPAKEDYEYRTAVVELLVYDSPSEPNRPYGVQYAGCDYYGKSPLRDKDTNNGANNGSNASGKVYFYGEEYEAWIKMTSEPGQWEMDSELDMWVLPLTYEIIAQVPVGYDGAVACIYDTAIISDDYKNSDGEYFPTELFPNNPGHYAAFRLD